MKEREKGTIERGKVLSVTGEGCTIASLDRDGITTPPMLPVNETETFSPGDKVYYFYFHDGTGRIICKL